jgi:hypothetical protein
MKTLIRYLLAMALAISVTGCATLNPGADPVVVRAEQSIKVAFDTFDTFLKMEKSNQARIRDKVPAVHEFAEWLRAPGPNGSPRGIAIIESANTVKNAYKRNRSPENKANLISALAAVEAAVSQTQKHLISIP